MNERRISSRVARCVGEVSLTPSIRPLGFSTTPKGRHDTGPVHRRIHPACGEYLLRTPEIRKSTPEGAVIRTPDLLAHRPFDFTTGLGEPSEG